MRGTVLHYTCIGQEVTPAIGISFVIDPQVNL